MSHFHNTGPGDSRRGTGAIIIRISRRWLLTICQLIHLVTSEFKNSSQHSSGETKIKLNQFPGPGDPDHPFKTPRILYPLPPSPILRADWVEPDCWGSWAIWVFASEICVTIPPCSLECGTFPQVHWAFTPCHFPPRPHLAFLPPLFCITRHPKGCRGFKAPTNTKASCYWTAFL